ncbi:MAG: hypothetical protein ACMUJM_16900 [bacterium]
MVHMKEEKHEVNCLAKAQRAIEDYLSIQGLDRDSINRIILEDLPFLTIWQLKPDTPEKIDKAEAVIAFAFGFGPAKAGVSYPPEQYHPLLYKPGKTNEALATTIVPFAQKGLEIFAQWEVAEALKPHGITIPHAQVACPGKEYLGTRGIIEQFLHNGLSQFGSVLLVAHRHHMYRCREITKTVFQKRNQPISIVIPDTPDMYDPDSIQWWTRSLKDWVTYEVGNRFNNRYQGNL